RAMESSQESDPPREPERPPREPPASRSPALKASIMINVAAVVAIIVIVILASVPLVQVDRTSVAWFGIKLGPGPGDLISYGHPGEFCPPQGGSDWAGVTGNVTLSFTWATKSGDPIENFSLWGEDYLKSPGSYLYRENNSSA